MAERTERRSSSSRVRLHNFTFPDNGLKWGSQRTLRCMKINPNSGQNGSPADSPSTDWSQPAANGLVEAPPSVESPMVNSGHRIPRFIKSNKMLEELMANLQNAADRLQISMDEEKEKGKGKEKAKEKVQYDKFVPRKTRNLRTRRPACTVQEVNGDGGRGGGSGAERGMNSNLWSPGWRQGSRLRVAAEEKLNRPKFSFTLTKEEIESDFISMTRAKLPKKPKKRPKAVQRKLNELAPGMWLREITPELYKVTDDPEPRKVRK